MQEVTGSNPVSPTSKNTIRFIVIILAQLASPDTSGWRARGHRHAPQTCGVQSCITQDFILLNNTNFTTISNKFSVFRNEHYSEIMYRENCKKLIGIPFNIKNKLHSLEQLDWDISCLHCISALRKILYDTLNIYLQPCYIRDLPKTLKEEHNYNEILVNKIQNWDIVFLRKPPKERISHVVLWLDQEQIFHSCRSRNTVIELFSCLDWEYSTKY